MTQTISRMYATHDQAERALAALKDYGYTHAHLVSTSDGEHGGDHTHESIVDRLTDAYVWKQHAEVYAKVIKGGGALVTVHAPFGAANDAEVILAKYDPIDSGVSGRAKRSVAWDEKTPMSSILQMPVLAKNKLPMTKIWNVPAVTSKPIKVSSRLGMKMLSQHTAPLSARLGLPLLSGNSTPLSSRFGLPTLSKKGLKLTPPVDSKR
jgi:hypothetical protein